MPIGIFAGSSSRPQPLSGSDEPERKRDKDSEKDAKGTQLKLLNTNVTIDKKLAEGGFAIVYLVSDKNNRNFALKRQFINDDESQVEACLREQKFINELRGHKNIVQYVDHILARNKSGIYEYMLLTVYYKTSVLQRMNDCLAAGRGFSPNEVLSIFCGMCEAVARLHQNAIPIMHRDLKVENILIDERQRNAPPIYVLCDFGSATTKILSSNSNQPAAIKEEIDKYTTLSYRAPEMIDIYDGKPIGPAADMWALGVMLYKLCYFSLPFGESAMAIQNGAFSFPSNIDCPETIKAIISVFIMDKIDCFENLKALIKNLLQGSLEARPSIFQCASLAFEAAQKECPVPNLKMETRVSLNEILAAFRAGRCVNFQTPHDDSVATTGEDKSDSEDNSPLCVPAGSETMGNRGDLTTTTVNPRLRPKPTNSVPVVPLIAPSPKPSPAPTRAHPPPPPIPTSDSAQQNIVEPVTAGPLSCPLAKPGELGFTDLEDALHRNRAKTDGTGIRPLQQDQIQISDQLSKAEGTAPSTVSLPDTSKTHRRNVSDTSQVMKSAFKPYSQTTNVSVSTNSVQEVSRESSLTREPTTGSWNPFLAAPFGSHSRMDDSNFGRAFDQLPRRPIDASSSSAQQWESDSGSIDSRDPFGAAPFDAPHAVSKDEATVEVRRELTTRAHDVGSVGSAEDLKGRMQGPGILRYSGNLHGDCNLGASVMGGVLFPDHNYHSSCANEEDSELDEQRMRARRRFSYEHIDGVGDDASSDSRGRTDHDSTDELSRNESSHDENDSSQQTDVASDDGGGKPLLEDDGLEDGEDEDAVDGYGSRRAVFPPLSIEPQAYRRNNNPFLNYDQPLDISHNNAHNTIVHGNGEDKAWKELDGWSWTNNIKAFDMAPATLPRQSTPLAARQREAQPLPSNSTISNAPVVPAHFHHRESGTLAQPPLVGAPVTVPDRPTAQPGMIFGQPTRMEPKYEQTMFTEPPVVPILRTAPVGKLISVQPVQPVVPAPVEKIEPNVRSSTIHQVTPQSSTITAVVHQQRIEKDMVTSSPVPAPRFVEGPRTPKPKKAKDKKRLELLSSDSEFETDGSEAEMCTGLTNEKGLSKKKKGKSAFVPSSTLEKKAATLDKRKTSTSKQRGGSQGALNASFVNSSFQCEEHDSPPHARAARV